MQKTKKVYFYTEANGKCYIKDWLNKLEIQIRARIVNRIARLEYGVYGDYKHIEGKINELRFFFGKGYRIYFVEEGQKIICLLNGGDKDSQQRDIQKAKALLQNCLE